VLPSPTGSLPTWHGPSHVAGAHTRSGNAMGRTRLGLLAGASRAFAEHGPRRSTMQSIAAAAGVSKATLYNHFRTKDEVASALLARELDRLTTLAAALPLDQSLAALSDELGAHPVLRRMAEAEPDALIGLLAVYPERWAELTGRLAAALGLDADGAEIAARWLLGVVLQPGRSTARRRHAARLAAVLPAMESGEAAEA
jgi:AcrR family transcriptional regulator